MAGSAGTDNARFGGFGRQDVSMPHFTDGEGNLSLYLLPRTALVLKRVGSAVMGPPPGAGGLACNSKNGRFIYPFVKGSVVRGCVRNAGWICAVLPESVRTAGCYHCAGSSRKGGAPESAFFRRMVRMSVLKSLDFSLDCRPHKMAPCVVISG